MVMFIRVRWIDSGAPWWSSVSFGFVGFILSLPVHSGAPWGLLASQSHAFSREEKAWYSAIHRVVPVIRSKRVGVRAEYLSMFSSEKRLRTIS